MRLGCSGSLRGLCQDFARNLQKKRQRALKCMRRGSKDDPKTPCKVLKSTLNQAKSSQSEAKSCPVQPKGSTRAFLFCLLLVFFCDFLWPCDFLGVLGCPKGTQELPKRATLRAKRVPEEARGASQGIPEAPRRPFLQTKTQKHCSSRALSGASRSRAAFEVIF